MILMDSMCLCTEEMELYWELMERREAWKLKGNFSKCKRRMRIMQHNFIFLKDRGYETDLEWINQSDKFNSSQTQ